MIDYHLSTTTCRGSCYRTTACVRSFLVCVDTLPPRRSENASYTAVKALVAGGAYAGSDLQSDCRSAACVLMRNVSTSTSCGLGDTCVAAPAPIAKFVVRLATSYARAYPPVYFKSAAVRTAMIAKNVRLGIAHLLCVPPHFLFIRPFRSKNGQIVEFAVLNPDVDAAAVARKVRKSIGARLDIYPAFQELFETLGFEVFISEAAVREGSPVNFFFSTSAPRRDRIPRFVFTFSGNSTDWLLTNSKEEALSKVKWRIVELVGIPYCYLSVNITLHSHHDYYHLVADVAVVDPSFDATEIAMNVKRSVGRRLNGGSDAEIIKVAIGEGSSIGFPPRTPAPRLESSFRWSDSDSLWNEDLAAMIAFFLFTAAFVVFASLGFQEPNFEEYRKSVDEHERNQLRYSIATDYKV